MTNLLRWTRGLDGHLFLQVLEDTEDRTKWKSYTASKFYEPDTIVKGLRMSKGFRTAQNCIKEGYQYLPSKEN